MGVERDNGSGGPDSTVDPVTWDGAALREVRRKILHLTLREVAEGVGVRTQTVWAWEHGTPPQIAHAQDLEAFIALRLAMLRG